MTENSPAFQFQRWVYPREWNKSRRDDRGRMILPLRLAADAGGTERGIYAASRPERRDAPGLSGAFIALWTVKRHKCRAPARWQYQDAYNDRRGHFSAVPTGTYSSSRLKPSVETLGYYLPSLRDYVKLALACLLIAFLPLSTLAQRPLGIDVSHYELTIDWSNVYNGSGIKFAVAKATEGGTNYYTDPYFTANEAGATANGVLMGAYHFARYDLNTNTTGAAAEAGWFWQVAHNYIQGGGKYLMPMLDVEASTTGYTQASLSAWVNAWCQTLTNLAWQSGVVIKPLIYISSSRAGTWMNSSVANQWYAWIAEWPTSPNPQTGAPSPITPWSNWTCWQYSDCTSVAGISGCVDGDVFNGYYTNLQQTLVIGGPFGNGALYASSSGVPTGVLPGQAFTATITMENVGANAWTNTGATPYQLGSQSPQDNTTWGLSRVSLPSSPIGPGANATFTISATAPTTPGTYTFAWRLIQGTTPFGDTFSRSISVGVNNAKLVSNSGIPSSVITGQTFTATIMMNNIGGTVWTNGAPTPYQLGSQSPQDNTTWGMSRVNLASSPVNPGQNATFTFTATAPLTWGNTPFAWRMIQGSTPFGDATTNTIKVNVVGTSGGTWWGNSDITPTSFGGTWSTSTDCGTYWYVLSHLSSCAARGFNMTFNPGFHWNGRGYIHMDWANTASKADSLLTMHFLNQAGSPSGPTSTWNDCTHTCSWQAVLDSEVADVYQYNGIYRNADEDVNGGSCGTVCGSAYSAGREIRMYGDKWVYLNDWVTFGGYGNSLGVATVGSGFNNPFGESGLYVYGALDTTHGNYFANNLYGGHTPYRVQTGDCGTNTSPGSGTYPNYLNFMGNAGQNGNNNCTNCDAYAFAWVNTIGAGPQWGVGSEDGDRIWLNGTLIADNNTARTLTWDQDRFLPTGFAGGWNRVLFKVHNGSSSSGGVISLHNGTDFHQVEPNIIMQPDRYGGFSAGYEQDNWYPQIVVNNFYGTSGPTNGQVFYGNSSIVNANGASNGQGPVPYWRTMQYQWGYGLGNADSNYADVSGAPTAASWSHSMTSVTGHRRMYFFAVSRSGRTSFQNSGATGGSRFQDSGNYGRYFDVYVDNVAPQNPNFSSVTAASTSEIDLGFAIPLDQGVNVAAGSTESAGGSGNQDSQNWYRVGDVAVQLYRNSSPISGWVTGTSVNDTGLAANTSYSYALSAWDNNSGLRGNWHNTTPAVGSTVAWTLSVAPGPGSVTPSTSTPQAGSNVVWTAIGGFGPGTLQYYRYAWDMAPTHAWTDTETQWSSSTITTVPTTAGAWYLHVKGYNGADVGNGTADYAVTASNSNSGLCSQTNVLLGISPNGNGTFTLTFLGTPQASYYVVGNTNVLGGTWSALASSTNTVTDTNGYWQITVSNSALQQFYRSVAINPCP
ncbi:MAG: hypothetical protein C5B50_03195 [Verrucomicrobia bacterium]|nr:MAG: hypothetical protein C5B50_03195 [Verrucomicrobiota bacterium]